MGTVEDPTVPILKKAASMNAAATEVTNYK